jgi:hypothetical protein
MRPAQAREAGPASGAAPWRSQEGVARPTNRLAPILAPPMGTGAKLNLLAKEVSKQNANQFREEI